MLVLDARRGSLLPGGFLLAGLALFLLAVCVFLVGGGLLAVCVFLVGDGGTRIIIVSPGFIARGDTAQHGVAFIARYHPPGTHPGPDFLTLVPLQFCNFAFRIVVIVIVTTLAYV